MEGMTEKRVTGDQVQIKNASDGHIPLDTDYVGLEESMNYSQERYLRCKLDFFNSYADDADLLAKSKRWQQAAHNLLRWAGTLFNAYPEDQEKRQLARDLMDKITKDSSIRHRNVCLHAEHEIQKDPASIDRMDKAEAEAGAFLRNAALTQVHFEDLFRKGKNYVGWEQQVETICSARVAYFREYVLPKDHIYLPGRIIPPYPVPRTKPVPNNPDPYELMKQQPVEAYVYDEKTDELVIREGYISEDGLIDDQSVTYDTENMTCTMKYRGSTPVTWDWWKAKDLTDLPEEGSWAEEYLMRAYDQSLRQFDRNLLEPVAYEDEVPEYNKLPEWKVKGQK